MTLHHTALMFEYALMGFIGIWLADFVQFAPMFKACAGLLLAFDGHVNANALSLSFYYMFNAVYGPECV